MSQTALPRRSLHDLLAEGIRQLITDGGLRPGDKISEPELCARFDVSRTPLREALKVLAAEGLVELRPRRGAVVASISMAEVDELFPIMGSLESLAGEILCDVVTEQGIARMQAIHAQLLAEYEARDEDAYLRTNRLFHETLFALTGNATLQAMYAQILGRIRACRFVVRKSAENWRLAMEEHCAIIEALAARDKRRLPKLLRQHVNGVTVAIARDAIRLMQESEELPEKPARRQRAFSTASEEQA